MKKKPHPIKAPPVVRVKPPNRHLIYTHVDEDGMRWRFVGSRPVSELADKVMQEGDW